MFPRNFTRMASNRCSTAPAVRARVVSIRPSHGPTAWKPVHTVAKRGRCKLATQQMHTRSIRGICTSAAELLREMRAQMCDFASSVAVMFPADSIEGESPPSSEQAYTIYTISRFSKHSQLTPVTPRCHSPLPLTHDASPTPPAFSHLCGHGVAIAHRQYHRNTVRIPCHAPRIALQSIRAITNVPTICVGFHRVSRGIHAVGARMA